MLLIISIERIGDIDNENNKQIVNMVFCVCYIILYNNNMHIPIY